MITSELDPTMASVGINPLPRPEQLANIDQQQVESPTPPQENLSPDDTEPLKQGLLSRLTDWFKGSTSPGSVPVRSTQANPENSLPYKVEPPVINPSEPQKETAT